jgi:hypothetical protein
VAEQDSQGLKIGKYGENRGQPIAIDTLHRESFRSNDRPLAGSMEAAGPARVSIVGLDGRCGLG